MARNEASFPRMQRLRWTVGLLVLAASCQGGRGATGPAGLPAIVIVTLIQPPAAPQQFVGFPSTLPRGASTLQVSAIDSSGANIVLDATRYRLDVTPATVPGLFTLISIANTTLGVTVLATGTVPVTWKLTDITDGRIAVGPTVTNVLLQ